MSSVKQLTLVRQGESFRLKLTLPVELHGDRKKALPYPAHSFF